MKRQWIVGVTPPGSSTTDLSFLNAHLGSKRRATGIVELNGKTSLDWDEWFGKKAVQLEKPLHILHTHQIYGIRKESFQEAEKMQFLLPQGDYIGIVDEIVGGSPNFKKRGLPNYLVPSQYRYSDPSDLTGVKWVLFCREYKKVDTFLDQAQYGFALSVIRHAEELMLSKDVSGLVNFASSSIFRNARNMNLQHLMKQTMKKQDALCHDFEPFSLSTPIGGVFNPAGFKDYVREFLWLQGGLWFPWFTDLHETNSDNFLKRADVKAYMQQMQSNIHSSSLPL